jgi:molecular chaperone GrpE
VDGVGDVAVDPYGPVLEPEHDGHASTSERAPVKRVAPAHGPPSLRSFSRAHWLVEGIPGRSFAGPGDVPESFYPKGGFVSTMSEDEGSVDSAADAEEADDAAAVEAAASGDEQAAATGGDASDESNAAAEEESAAQVADDGFVTADPESVDADDADDADEAAGEDGGGGGTPVSEDIVDRVAEYDDEAAAEVRALVERAFELKTEAQRVPELEARVDELEDDVEDLREEREDLTSKLRRKQADFKNYKERQKRKQEQMKERATEDLVERLVGVRDNLKRALDQDVDDDESIRGGVEMTLKEFDRVLDEENVEEIAPETGDDVDPQRHEVMVRVDSDLPEGTIAELFNPGYEMAGRVIQAAQVTVSNGAEHDPEDGDDAEDATAETDGSGAADDGGDDEAVALGGEVDDESVESGDDDAEASDEDISAALDDE